MGIELNDNKLMQMSETESIIYGIRPVMEAIDNGKTIDKILLQKGLSSALFKELFFVVRQNKIPFQYVPSEKLNRYTRGNHQGVVAMMSSIEYGDIYSIIPTLYETGKVPFLLSGHSCLVFLVVNSQVVNIIIQIPLISSIIISLTFCLKENDSGCDRHI